VLVQQNLLLECLPKLVESVPVLFFSEARSDDAERPMSKGQNQFVQETLMHRFTP